jgi:hypothetical protein
MNMFAFGGDANLGKPKTGTTIPIPIRTNSDCQPIRPGKDYLVVQIYAAQAVFTGPFWIGANHLVVSTQVNLNHPNLGNEGLRAIQRSREIKRNRAEQLGLSPNLISLVPATMNHVSITIDFIVDTTNRLVQLSGMINSDCFLSAISVTPGAALVAKTIGGISQKILQTFVPAETRQPILQFTGDFNIGSDSFAAGYYAILGTRDENSPLPDPLPSLEIKDGDLFADGEKVTRFSYVVLKVTRTEARTRDLNDGAVWDIKLRDAETKAMAASLDPQLVEGDRTAIWNECKKLLQDARTLMLVDPNYLRIEVDAILEKAFTKCADLLYGGKQSRAPTAFDRTSIPQKIQVDGISLGIPMDDGANRRIANYSQQEKASLEILHAIGIS